METLPSFLIMNISAVQRYLSKHHLFGEELPLADNVPDLIVVVPCYDEPDLRLMLDSLEQAMQQQVRVELIVVVNDGEHSSLAAVEQNDLTYDALMQWRQESCFSFTLLPVRLKGVRRKHAGVGYARKVGMDLAVWRLVNYAQVDVPLVSLDADTLVEANYIEALYHCFIDPKVKGAILRFEHAIEGEVFDRFTYEAVARYELHLRYLHQGLKYSGYPYVCHAVGSAFAVRASAYAKHGGMNRRQGGEDFYFLHKLLPHEHFVPLNTTCVYPSSRPSLRVPFGTGPQVSQSTKDGYLLTYHPDVFDVLKEFVAQVPLLYVQDVTMPLLLQRFFENISFEERLVEIRKNASTTEAFVKRFFAYFDAFQLVKFLNFSHQEFFDKIDVEAAAKLLLQRRYVNPSHDLLTVYRKIDGK